MKITLFTWPLVDSSDYGTNDRYCIDSLLRALVQLIWELSICFLHIYRQWSLWSVIGCWLLQFYLSSITWATQTKVPTTAAMAAKPGAEPSQWAVCPLMLWSRLSKFLSTLRVVPYSWGCWNSAYKKDSVQSYLLNDWRALRQFGFEFTIGPQPDQ